MPKKKKEPRLTAARYVSKQYGEKGLRALKAMGAPFGRVLQREIVDRRDLQVLLDKRDAMKKAMEDLEAKIAKREEDLPEDASLPKLEAVIETLPNIGAKKKAEKPDSVEQPVEQPEEHVPAAEAV